jgi:hypothetical protein
VTMLLIRTNDPDRLPRPSNDPAPEPEEPDFWQAADADDAARLLASHAATKALAAVFRLAEEIAGHVTGEDYREEILNLEAQLSHDAARLEATAAKQYDGIATSALRHFQHMPASMADWSADVVKRAKEIEDMAVCLAERARCVPVEPGSVDG